MMHRVFQVNIGVIVLGIALFGYWYFLDGWLRPPLEFEIDPLHYKTDRMEYAPGDPVQVYVDYCKTRPGQGTVTWTLVDTIKLFYPEKVSNAAPGCYEGYVQIVTLPKLGIEGIYHLEGNGKVQINPIKAVPYTYKTQPFLVTPSAE